MNILYLINHYPKVSHTFIRREIQALETLGNTVHRVAMRHDDADSMSDIDKPELTKTHYVLKQSKVKLLFGFVLIMLSSPKRFLSAFSVLLKMNKASKENFLKHIIYLVESVNVADFVKVNKVEHIHAHFGTNPAEVAMYTSLLTNVPYSFTVHGPEEFDKPLTLNLHEKIKHAKSVVAITSYCRSQLFRWSRFEDWNKIKIVHCGLEKGFFDETSATKTSANQMLQFLCIGRICEQKGQLLLLKAFNRFVQDGINAKLVLAGDGDMRAEVERFIKECKIEDKVEITGWVDSAKIKALLETSHAMVLPSFAEGLPVAIMEAMASNVPIISTSIAGIPELIKHRKTGLLITPGSVTEIQKALNEFASLSEDELKKMKSQSFDAVYAEHLIDTEATKLANIFASENT